RPVRVITCPARTDATGTDSSSGSMWVPDSVGDMPFTAWKKSGSTVTGPSSAPPTRNDSALDTRKTGTVNSFNGTIGTSTRCSTSTHRKLGDTPATARPQVVGELQGRPEPPRVGARARQVVAVIVTAAPG